MRALVVGGSGFIGTRLVSMLLDAGHSVEIFDKADSARFPELTTRGDVRDRAALLRVVGGRDVVYNLAAEHKDDVKPVSLYYQVNVVGMRNVVDACDANLVRRLIFTSTVAVYGLNAGIPDEQTMTQPFNDYGKSKLQAEEIVGNWARAGEGRCATIVRPCVVFGEGNRGNVFNLIHQIASGTFLMVGAGENRKSMAYVENVAAFLVAMATAEEPGVHLFNYADKPDLATRELVAAIRCFLGIDGAGRAIPYWLGIAGGMFFDSLAFLTRRSFPVSRIRVRKFCSETVVSSTRAMTIGFTPPFSLSEGMSRFLASELSAGGKPRLEPNR